MGCAKDIVENVGVPRFWFSDFPLGHSAGKPHDRLSQADTLSCALRMFDDCTAAGTTRISPQVWANDDGWKNDFMDTSKLNPDVLAKLKQEHENTRAIKALKEKAP